MSLNIGQQNLCLLKHTQSIANLLARQWRKPDKPGRELSPNVFSISSTSTTFSEYYDEIQELLKSMARMDQLLLDTAKIGILIINVDQEVSAVNHCWHKAQK